MNETDWLSTCNVMNLLRHIEAEPKIATVRQMRQFRAACNRLVVPYLGNPALLKCVEASEEYAEGIISNAQLRKIVDEGYHKRDDNTKSVRGLAQRLVLNTWHFDEDVPYECRMLHGDEAELRNILEAVAPSRYGLTWNPDIEGRYPNFFRTSNERKDVYSQELPPDAPAELVGYVLEQRRDRELYNRERQEIEQTQRRRVCHMLRDIVPNPFRQFELNASWVTPDVYLLAQEIATTHDYNRMWNLGDLIQEAGADYGAISHCYNDHVRGCWYLETVLAIGQCAQANSSLN